VWQFIAGGGEGVEEPLSAAKREAREEAAISEGEWMPLDSKASIPRKHFPKAQHWEPSILVIPEHAFAVALNTRDVVLSDEHSEVQWLSSSGAECVLTFDSNRVALWELEERLKRPNQSVQPTPGSVTPRAID
jgi:dihydroneopterin triphosphate diphosphatase